MRKCFISAILIAFIAIAHPLKSQTGGVRELSVRANKFTATVAPTMYGIFFEDINFGADGGLYAEMIENRSFEAPYHISPDTGRRICGGLLGWKAYGDVTIDSVSPAFERNPHYAVLRGAGHRKKYTGLENSGYFGIGVKKDMHYDFSVYMRSHGKLSKIRVELVDASNNVIDDDTVSVAGKEWEKITCRLVSDRTDADACLRMFLVSDDGADIDHVSLFPSDCWNGLRADLVKHLEDLHPGVFRFPGGCIVEGTYLANRYQWKNTIGPVENRPINENRWNDTFVHRMSPDYYQSYGLGFYEYFLLSEKIGASPLPILNCGLSCQYQNKDNDPRAHAALDDLQPYIDDALDLIEFANGDITTRWGKVRSDMGHPAPFNLKYIGIGNEQWGEIYAVRLEPFVKAIRAKYPDIEIVGSSGPSADGEKFDYGWEQMRRIGVDLVDEHYYKSPEWFLDNACRYDSYSRKGPKVFAGEYAAHAANRANNFEAALSEAAFMTGLERNADVVRMATYAPLFAHVRGWQWRPDLIWFDNLRSVRSVNWYVQQMYGVYKGTHVVTLTENGKAVAGDNQLYASAVYDSAKKCYYVKIVNTASDSQNVCLSFRGIKKIGDCLMTVLHADDSNAQNTLDNPSEVVPYTSVIEAGDASINLSVKEKSFVVLQVNGCDK